MSISLYGPSLPNLVQMLDTDLDVLGQAAAAQNLGELLGSSSSLLLYKRINIELTLALAALLTGLCTALAPAVNAAFFIVMIGFRGYSSLGLLFHSL